MRNTIIFVCIALLVGFGVGYFVNHQGVVGGTNLYPDWYYNGLKVGQQGTASFDNSGNFQAGGDVIASSTNAADTMTATQLLNYTSLKLSPIPAAGSTITLPASSTLKALIPADGEWTERLIENATTSAANVTIAAGTGVSLVTASTTGAVINFKKGAVIRFIRLINTDIEAFLFN